jgi:hypothetical protein
MTVGERGGSRTQVLSVDVGALSVMSRQNGAATASGLVTVHGAGMGPAPKARIAAYPLALLGPWVTCALEIPGPGSGACRETCAEPRR